MFPLALSMLLTFICTFMVWGWDEAKKDLYR